MEKKIERKTDLYMLTITSTWRYTPHS